MTPDFLEQDPASAAPRPAPGNKQPDLTDGNPSSPSYSDNDGGERPVRQQLKETNLDTTTQKNANNKRSHDRSDNDATSEADAPPKKRSRECTPETASRSQDTSSLQKNGSKKRSLDDSDNDATSEADAPPKKRSRECTPEKSSGAQNPTSNTSSGVEQPETDTAPDGYHLPETEKPPATMEPTETKTVPPDETLAAEAQRQKTNNSDERKTKMNQTFSSSAFGNTSTDSPFSSAFRSSTTSTSVFGSSMASTSATSPFTTLSANAKEPAVTPNPSNNNNPASTSAFASSSLSAFAGSDDSPFGNLAAGTSTSVFGKPANSTGFSTFSSAFPATGKSGGLTSFASPKVTSSFGDSKAKAQPLGAKAQAFGAVQSDNEDSENEQDDEGNGNDTFVAEKTDERFVEQPVETGEEDEETIFANKGKLYCFDNKQWKERGVGTFKVNVKSGPDGKRTARMIMRADGALRVMLNSAIFKGMHFGDQQGAAPAGRRIFLASKEDGKVANVLLQLNNENTVNELYATLKDFLEEV